MQHLDPDERPRGRTQAADVRVASRVPPRGRALLAAVVLGLGSVSFAACTAQVGTSPPGGVGGSGPDDTGGGGNPARGTGGGTVSGGGGAKGAGGSPATTGTGGGGPTGSGGGGGPAGATGTGGRAGTGGATGTGGRVGTGGAGGVVVEPPVTGMCGSTPVQINSRPFGCSFGWGATNATGRPAFLNFVTTWVGDETNGGLASFSATAASSTCGDCQLVQQVAAGTSMVAFYAYFIGFQACRQGNFCDCNTHSPPNLCTNGAQWIRDNRAVLINMYAQYAKRVYAVSPNKPVIWWLEGDFVQYSYSMATNPTTFQTNPLSYAELGALTRDITCAIKLNEPNAIVAMNHSPWIGTDVANGFWSAQPNDVLDMVWVQGYGDSETMPNTGTYNAASATFTWLHQKTGRTIMTETSFAGAGANDRWTTTTAANINQRIADGIVGVNIVNPASTLSSVPPFTLNSVCQ